MRINSISFNPNINNYINYKNQKIKNHQTSSIYTGQSDRTALNSANALLINFNGGASLNLKATIENLEFLGAAFNKAETVFPPKIREMAMEIINSGNPKNKRLIDIHKDIFGQIKECETLSEIKQAFKKEGFFDGVLSDSEVTFTEGSFADTVKKGANQYFDKDEDLSVQIIKLYWGDGFSLSDLKTYTGGKDINHLLNRLHIPKRDKHYGAYLKLSDEEYNNRITSEMAAKRLETLDKKAQALEGEPVYIPRKPLSELHKQHISEGLIRYYQENPHACYNISQRQREFYEKNPEQKLIFSEVLKRAWGLKSAEGIKKALSKHLSRAGIKNFDFSLLSNPLAMDNKQSIAMKSFWVMNDWARKSHSKNMQYAWKTVKEDLENPKTIMLFPMEFVSDITSFAKSKGKDFDIVDLITDYNLVTKQTRMTQNGYDTVIEYFENERNADTMASLYQYTLVQIDQQLQKTDITKKSKPHKLLSEIFKNKYRKELYTFNPQGKITGTKNLNVDESKNLYISAFLDAQRVSSELADEFYLKLNEYYQLIKKTVDNEYRMKH